MIFVHMGATTSPTVQLFVSFYQHAQIALEADETLMNHGNFDHKKNLKINN